MGPTPSQLTPGGGGDVTWEFNLGGSPVYPGTGDRFVSLTNGTTPTFQTCTTDTLFTLTEPNTPGTAFCVIEPTGKMVGVTIMSLNSKPPEYIDLNVTVWSNVAS
jgi:hypothetical protein